MKKIIFVLILVILVSGCVKQIEESTEENQIEKLPSSPQELPEQAESEENLIEKLEDNVSIEQEETTIEDTKEEEEESAEEFNLRGIWHSEIVDDNGWVGIDSLIAVDSNGNPHICHYDQGNRDLKYAYFDGSSWNLETIDSQGDVGEECGIAVDSNGNPHISYIDVTNGGIKYAAKTTSWSIETIDKKSGAHVVSTSIALDSNGNQHIAYNMESNDGDKVKYASWDGGSWNIEIVSSGGMDVYLALDSNNEPYISLIRDLLGDKARIYYARKISGKWKVEMADSSTISGGDTGIAVDSNNYVHITYHDYGNGAIKYAKWDGTSWNIQTVAADLENEEGLKIAVDAMNNPHIIYSDSKKELLMYATLKEGVWNKEIVSKMGNPSITVDYLGRVHVAHGYTPESENLEDEIEILKYSVRK